MTVYYIDNPFAVLLRRLSGEPPAPGPDYRADLAELRKAVTDLTTVTAAQNERIEGQRNEIEKSHKLIKELETSGALLRGDLREAYTRITSLESQLLEERTARTKQAVEFGDMQGQLRIADERLKHQRDEIDAHKQRLAILDDERAKAEGVATVWRSRAELAEKHLAAARARIAELEHRDEGGAG